MTEEIAVLGANGVYARHLIPRLVAVGHKVRALVRRVEAATLAQWCGADVRVADIFDIASMTAALEGCSMGINLATSLPGPSGRGDFATNDILRIEGTPNWLEACRRAGVNRVIQQSIGLINSSNSTQWSDEETIFQSAKETTASRAIAACLLMEKAVEESGLDWLTLRGGLFYGPGTGYDDTWHSMAKVGKLRLPGKGEDFVSLIHIADMAAATLKAIELWPSRRALIVCDNNPAPWREIFSFINTMAGQDNLQEDGVIGFPSFRLKNKRACEVLQWSPFYQSYHTGLIP